ncbi:hypothetical protein BASA81_007516 [Batrachochytrium salamandrivorans]|nr:hypothetical protein BASA81_007516 [Batrachochytrium salamandrivorans]
MESNKVLDSGLLSGSMNVDEYATEISRQHSLERALREVELLRKQNLELAGKLKRSAGDFTDEVFVQLKRERDDLFALVQTKFLEPEARKRKFPQVAALYEARANGMQVLKSMSMLLNVPEDKPAVAVPTETMEETKQWYQETFGEELKLREETNQEAEAMLQEYEIRQIALEGLNATLQERLQLYAEAAEEKEEEVNVYGVYQRKQLAAGFYSWREMVTAKWRMQSKLRAKLFLGWRQHAQTQARSSRLAEMFALRSQRFQLQLAFQCWRLHRAPPLPPAALPPPPVEEPMTLVKLRLEASALRTPAMMLAASRGMTNLVLELINEGAPVNLKDRGRHGATPLHAACESGVAETVELLLESGAVASQVNDLGETCLQRVAAKRTGNVEVAMVLLKHDESLLSLLTADGRSVLHLAVDSRASPQFVSVLLESKLAVVEQQQRATGNTALHAACLLGDAALVKLLVEHLRCKAEDFPRNTKDYTVLHLACMSTGELGDQPTVIDLLLDCGFQCTWFSATTRETALHVLCENPHAKLDSLGLFFPEAELDFKDGLGNTALHYACQYQLREIALELVRKGASLYLLNHQQDSPLDLVPPGFAIQLLGSIRFPLFLSRAKRDHRDLTRCMVCKDSVNVGFLHRRVADHCRRCGRLCCAKCSAHRSVLRWDEGLVPPTATAFPEDGVEEQGDVHKICKHCAEILTESEERSDWV